MYHVDLILIGYEPSVVYATIGIFFCDGSMWNQYSFSLIVYVCISHCIVRISCILRVESCPIKLRENVIKY